MTDTTDINVWPGLQELLPFKHQTNQAIRIWLIDTSKTETAADYVHCLSADEQQRADCLQVEAHKLNFITVRAAVRYILGRLLSCSPKAIRFNYGPAGRPEVAWPPTSLSFNVSHSGTFALIAVSPINPIGVDLEYLQQAINPQVVGHQVFCTDEQRQLELYTEPERTRFFFRMWTAKEAVLKVIGAGFSLEPRDFNIVDAISGDGLVDLPASLTPPGMNSQIRLIEFEIDNAYLAALAIGTGTMTE